jgi:hypothetical protein
MQDKNSDKTGMPQPGGHSSGSSTPKEPKNLLDAVVRANKKGPLENIKMGESTPTSSKSAGNERAVPAFDLAEEIMAQQRKITAIKRKSPAAKTNGYTHSRHIEPLHHSVTRDFSRENHLIAEIVARDIKRLCGEL